MKVTRLLQSDEMGRKRVRGEIRPIKGRLTGVEISFKIRVLCHVLDLDV